MMLLAAKSSRLNFTSGHYSASCFGSTLGPPAGPWLCALDSSFGSHRFQILGSETALGCSGQVRKFGSCAGISNLSLG